MYICHCFTNVLTKCTMLWTKKILHWWEKKSLSLFEEAENYASRLNGVPFSPANSVLGVKVVCLPWALPTPRAGLRKRHISSCSHSFGLEPADLGNPLEQQEKRTWTHPAPPWLHMGGLLGMDGGWEGKVGRVWGGEGGETEIGM